jgi:hypothetical protein
MNIDQLQHLERKLLDIVESISASLECEPVDTNGEYTDRRAGDIEYLAASIRDIAVSVARIRERRTNLWACLTV